jgi:biopolymer transport protein ExbB/TolQ
MDIVQTFLEMALLGSAWVLWLLVLLSILSVAVMIERFNYFRKRKIDFAKFHEELNQALIRKDYQAAENICDQYEGIEATVAKAGIQHRHLGVTAMGELMASKTIAAKQGLDHGLVILGTLGNNAPFIGLFGTVLGIIEAFNSLAENTGGGPSVVMAGISEALVATAVGLLVAIPAVIAFNASQRVVKKFIGNAEVVAKLISAHAEG